MYEEATRRIIEAQASYIISQVVGVSEDTARNLLESSGGIAGVARLPESHFVKFHGIGPKRAEKIKLLSEWAVLLGKARNNRTYSIRNPEDAARLVMLEMMLLEQEELRIISLTTKNMVISTTTVYRGSLNRIVVRVEEIIKVPMRHNADSFVLVHNHPSGDPTPSPEDVVVTELINEACKMFGIEMLDHVIIGMNEFFSLRDRGLGGFGVYKAES
jgi:DNA repair protein RadC